MLQSNKDIENKLKEQRRIAEEEDAKRRAVKNNLPYLNPVASKISVSIEALSKVKEEEAREALLASIQLFRNKMLVIAFDYNLPKTKEVINKLREQYDVEINIVSLSSLEFAWNYYKYVIEEKAITGSIAIDENEFKKIFENIKTLENFKEEIKNFSSPYLSKILEIILGGSIALNSSDIHLEPKEESGKLRVRIDGILHDVFDNLNKQMFKSIVTRIKLLSNLKININNEPQDGRFTIKLPEKNIEIRTSIIPSDYGETVV